MVKGPDFKQLSRLSKKYIRNTSRAGLSALFIFGKVYKIFELSKEKTYVCTSQEHQITFCPFTEAMSAYFVFTSQPFHFDYYIWFLEDFLGDYPVSMKLDRKTFIPFCSLCFQCLSLIWLLSINDLSVL